MSNPSYLNPVLNRSTIRDEVKNVLFDFYRGTSYVSAGIARIGLDAAKAICSKKDTTLREKLDQFINGSLPSYKEEQEIHAIANHLESVHSDNTPQDFFDTPATDEQIERFVAFAETNIPRYGNFSMSAKGEIQKIIEEHCEFLMGRKNTEWNPVHTARIGGALNKCNKHIGGLDHLIHECDPLRNAVANCYIRDAGFSDADYGITWRGPDRIKEETVPIILNRLTQVVLTYLPRDDISPAEAKSIFEKLNKYGSEIMEQAKYLEWVKHENDPSGIPPKEKALFEEHCNQQLMPLKETVERLLQSAQMALTSDIGQTLDIKETNEKPMVSTSPSL